MIASRFWFGLLGLGLSGATLVLYLAISMHDRLGVRMVSEGLSADSRVVSWYLKNSAREGAAQLIRFAANDAVARSMASASRANDASQIDTGTRRQLKAALTRIASEIPESEGFDAVFAVTQSGEVAAHIGFEQAASLPDFELGGYPVVADALHGYVRDDTLLFDRMYRVVARPIEFELGQLPAGAIVGARLVDDGFAGEVSARTGAAIAFYANGRREGIGLPSGFDRTGLDQLVTHLPSLEHDPDYKEKGRSDVHDLGGGLAVVYARLPGEAWQLGAGYAVARQTPRVEGPLGVLERADSKDKEAVSTLLLVALALGAAGVGLLLSYWEHTAPLEAFRRQVKALAGGGVAHLGVDKLRAPFRQLALDLNLAIDRLPRSRAGEDAPISVGFEQMFGDAAPAGAMSAFMLPGSVPPSVGVSEVRAPPAFGEVASSNHGLSPVSPGLPPRRVRQAAALQPTAMSAPDAGQGTWPRASAEAFISPPDLPASGAAPINGADVVDPDWTRVYHDFVRLKQDCGEAVEGFTFERFTSTLRKNRDTLMQEHGVQHVQFSAYVKQGRAALKAKPVRA